LELSTKEIVVSSIDWRPLFSKTKLESSTVKERHQEEENSFLFLMMEEK